MSPIRSHCVLLHPPGPALNPSSSIPVFTVSSNDPTDDPLPTPPICHVLPAENDRVEYDRDKRTVDGEMRGVDRDFRGHHDRDGDHGKILHYSDITITIKSASEDNETQPDQVLTTELHPQPTKPLHSQKISKRNGTVCEKNWLVLNYNVFIMMVT